MAIYEALAIKIDGILLSDNTALNITGVGQDQDVETTPGGFSGQSLAPRKIQIEPTDAIGPNWQPVDIWSRWIDGAEVEVEVIAILSNQKLKTTGFIRDPKINGGVGRTTERSWMIMCKPAKWE